MVKKEFTYRGKTMQELSKMEIKEITLLLPARARRSLKHGLTDQQKILLERIKKFKLGKIKKTIKTQVRDMVILPEMVGVNILVHRGKEFMPVNITEEMIGHYLGEFTYNRKRVQHSAPGIGATRSSAAASVK